MADYGLLSGLAAGASGFLDEYDKAQRRELERQKLVDQQMRQAEARGDRQAATALKRKMLEIQEKRLALMASKEKAHPGLLPKLDEEGRIIPDRYQLKPSAQGKTEEERQAWIDYTKAKAEATRNPPARQGRSLAPEELDLKKAQAEVARARAQGLLNPQGRPAPQLHESQIELNKARAEAARRGPVQRELDPSQVELNRARAEALKTPKPTPQPKNPLIDGQYRQKLGKDGRPMTNAAGEPILEPVPFKPGNPPKEVNAELEEIQRMSQAGYQPRLTKDGLVQRDAGGKIMFQPKPERPVAPRATGGGKGGGKGRAAAPARITDGMYTAARFGQAALQAEREMDAIYSSGKAPSVNQMTAWKAAPKGGLLGFGLEYAKPENVKALSQAEENFVNAILRKDTGAAISPEEFKRYESQYFPRANDTPAIVAQKKRNRQAAINALKNQAGGAWNEDTIPEVPKYTGTPKESPVGTKKPYGGDTWEKFKAGPDNDKNNWRKVPGPSKGVKINGPK